MALLLIIRQKMGFKQYYGVRLAHLLSGFV